jgi:hypothetical protein
MDENKFVKRLKEKPATIFFHERDIHETSTPY